MSTCPKRWDKRMHQGVNVALYMKWFETFQPEASNRFVLNLPSQSFKFHQVSIFLETVQDIPTPFHGLVRKKQGSGRAGGAHSTGPQGAEDIWKYLKMVDEQAMSWAFFMGTMMIICHRTWPDSLENDVSKILQVVVSWALILWTSRYSEEKVPKVVPWIQAINLLIFWEGMAIQGPSWSKGSGGGHGGHA